MEQKTCKEESPETKLTAIQYRITTDLSVGGCFGLVLSLIHVLNLLFSLTCGGFFPVSCIQISRKHCNDNVNMILLIKNIG